MMDVHLSAFDERIDQPRRVAKMDVFVDQA